MSTKLESLATVLMAVAALAVAGKYFTATGQPAGASSTRGSKAPVLDERYSEAKRFALPSSSPTAAVTLLEFIDVECPFCASYARTVDSVRALLRDSVDVRYVNMPLTGHRMARSGAAAIECAYRQNRGSEFVSQTFAHQDSIAFWSWPQFAARAGIADTAAFRACLGEASIRARVDSSVALADSLGIRGTPTVFVQGWRYDNPPRLDALLRDIRLVAAGKAVK